MEDFLAAAAARLAALFDTEEDLGVTEDLDDDEEAFERAEDLELEEEPEERLLFIDDKPLSPERAKYLTSQLLA